MIFYSTIIFFSSLESSPEPKKFYIEIKDICKDKGKIYINNGYNIWYELENIYNDDKGVYIIDYCNIMYNQYFELNKECKWKCPYCHNFYDIKKPCTFQGCQSKFR